MCNIPLASWYPWVALSKRGQQGQQVYNRRTYQEILTTEISDGSGNQISHTTIALIHSYLISIIEHSMFFNLNTDLISHCIRHIFNLYSELTWLPIPLYRNQRALTSLYSYFNSPFLPIIALLSLLSSNHYRNSLS